MKKIFKVLVITVLLVLLLSFSVSAEIFIGPVSVKYDGETSEGRNFMACTPTPGDQNPYIKIMYRYSEGYYDLYDETADQWIIPYREYGNANEQGLEYDYNVGELIRGHIYTLTVVQTNSNGSQDVYGAIWLYCDYTNEPCLPNPY